MWLFTIQNSWSSYSQLKTPYVYEVILATYEMFYSLHWHICENECFTCMHNGNVCVLKCRTVIWPSCFFFQSILVGLSNSHSKVFEEMPYDLIDFSLTFMTIQYTRMQFNGQCQKCNSSIWAHNLITIKSPRHKYLSPSPNLG